MGEAIKIRLVPEQYARYGDAKSSSRVIGPPYDAFGDPRAITLPMCVCDSVIFR